MTCTCEGEGDLVINRWYGWLEHNVCCVAFLLETTVNSISLEENKLVSTTNIKINSLVNSKSLEETKLVSSTDIKVNTASAKIVQCHHIVAPV